MTPSKPVPDQKFPSTSWSLVVAARVGSPTGRSARAELLSRYYRPVYEFLAVIIGRQDTDELDDIAQDFFKLMWEKGRPMTKANAKRGSFREYMKQALRNHVVDRVRRKNRKKRLPEQGQVRPDQWEEGWERLNLQEEARAEIDDEASAGAAFDEEWIRAQIGEALARVRQICREKGKRSTLRCSREDTFPSRVGRRSGASSVSRSASRERKPSSALQR